MLTINVPEFTPLELKNFRIPSKPNNFCLLWLGGSFWGPFSTLLCETKDYAKNLNEGNQRDCGIGRDILRGGLSPRYDRSNNSSVYLHVFRSNYNE